MNRVAQPADIAEGVAFLASDDRQDDDWTDIACEWWLGTAISRDCTTKSTERIHFQ
jgi:hypothetical protein